MSNTQDSMNKRRPWWEGGILFTVKPETTRKIRCRSHVILEKCNLADTASREKQFMNQSLKVLEVTWGFTKFSTVRSLRLNHNLVADVSKPTSSRHKEELSGNLHMFWKVYDLRIYLVFYCKYNVAFCKTIMNILTKCRISLVFYFKINMD
jgi:hypothetical protein